MWIKWISSLYKVAGRSPGVMEAPWTVSLLLKEDTCSKAEWAVHMWPFTCTALGLSSHSSLGSHSWSHGKTFTQLDTILYWWRCRENEIADVPWAPAREKWTRANRSTQSVGEFWFSWERTSLRAGPGAEDKAGAGRGEDSRSLSEKRQFLLQWTLKVCEIGKI